MKTTLKYMFKFIEINTRLNGKKARTKTLELPRDLFDTYNVTGMVSAFKAAQHRFTNSDSTVVIKAVKIGRTEFQV